MARISLRAYQRDIEELVETHQFDQAIAHCRHVLRFYPKDVNTYRLLGKAYLESQRYGDASDIFIRVLSTIPDDFVSHVGMSIIREDEGNLDEAIWHMQRAFETQPANSAIQSELRRLHGRREGIEPPKIRLTRGALARMYLKGELYAQALAELRAGLHEDPKRFDLQVVLAQAYYLAGQRVDAAEASSTLLKSLPFCLEANKILADILSHSERADEAQTYVKRVQSLDPYMAHLSPTVSAAEKVAESAVLLEKLEWRPGLQSADTIQQPEWATSLGVDLGTVTGSDSMPDWLTGSDTKDDLGGSVTPESFEEKQTVSEEPSPVVSNAVPDWMKDAGWMESQDTGNEAAFLPLSETDGVEPDLAPADIPEWLKTMAPSGAVDEAAHPIPPLEPLPVASAEDAQAAVLPWLDETPPGPTDSVAMWLEKQEPAANLDDQMDLGSTDVDSIPDWLQDLGEPVAVEKTLEEPIQQTMQHEENLPTELEKEELSTLGVVAGITAAAGLLHADRQDEEPLEELSDELADELQPEDGMQAATPDWLQELGSVESVPAVESTFTEAPIETAPAAPDEPLAQADIPDWIQELEPVPGVQTTQEQQEEILTTAASSVFDEELEQFEPATGIEAQPDEWVAEIGEGVSKQGTHPDSVAIPMPTEAQALEDDEAFAWLENLAARQGAEEAMLLSPEERRETPPEWILSAAEEEQTQEPKIDLAAEVAGAVLLANAISDDSTEVMDETPADEIISTSPPEQEQADTEELVMLPVDEMPFDAVVAEAAPASSDLEVVAEIPSEPSMQVASAEAGSEEMLFYPLETAESGEQPISLDEGPIVEEDTKPRAIKAEPMDTSGTVAVAAGVIGAVASMDEEPMPVLVESEAETIAPAPEPVDVTPQLVEAPEPGAEAAMATHELEKPIAEGVVIPEEDEAFAWLESLAVRQGADEALLLAPEERLESPPDWVAQEAAEAEEEVSDAAMGEAELPAWLQETPEPAQEIPEAGSVASTETGVPDWLIAPAAIVAEKIVEKTGGDEATTPLAPELPTWLEGIEDTQKVAEATGWTPSEESFDEMEAETSPEISDLDTEIILEPALDLNKAGLVDLERLPGVGFIKAQAILDYRDKHGPFREVDELLLVAGITPEVLLDLKQHLSVGETDTAVEQEPPAEDHQILLVQARNALVQGDIPLAISRYSILIEKNQVLPDVIADLNEALYRFPIDISIWESLGDAHMHAGHLQEALNAYTKAEEYLH
jgi:competence ComEA-like helix-hairpin-helix protein